MIKKIDNRSLKIITSNLGNLLKAGINIEMSFEILEDMVENKYYKEALKDIRYNLKKGVSLGECFRKNSILFPNMFSQLITLGEENGKLEKILNKLSVFYANIENTRKRIKSLLIYPKILVISCILVLIFSITTLVPQIVNIYDSSNGELPYFVGNLHKLSIFIKENLLYSISLVFCYGIVLFIFLKALNVKDKLMNILKKSKMFKLYYEQNIIFILYIVFSSGNDLNKGLRLMEKGYEEVEIKNRINEILKFINRGESLGSYFKDKKYSKITYNMIKIGYETGNLEERLEEVLNSIEKELENKVQKCASHIGPISIGIVGVFIAFIMLTTLMPMFSAIGTL